MFSEPDFFSDQDPFAWAQGVLFWADLGSTPLRPSRTTTQPRLGASEPPGSLRITAERGLPIQLTYRPHFTAGEVEAQKGDGCFWGHITV